MITPKERADIEVCIMKKYDIFDDLKWVSIDKGLINKKYSINSSDETPLAVCKIFSEDDIYIPELRMERELQALKIMDGRGTPELLYSNKKGIIVYNYIPGIELTKARNFKNGEEKISSAIKAKHQITMQSKTALKSDVVRFYKDIIQNFADSETNYPKDLQDELKDAVSKSEKILNKNEEEIAYIHGDPVPANFIVGQKFVHLIDWEFFRPELKIFDYAYFDYYAKAHKMDISLTKNFDRDIVSKYTALVKALNDLWLFGYKQKQEK